MGSPPSGHGWTITSPSGPRPRQALPRTSSRGTRGSHVPAGPRPVGEPTRATSGAAGSGRESRPQFVAAGSRPGRHVPPHGWRGAGEAQGRASPRHVEGAVTDEVTAHGVKRFGPAGPGAARGPSRRGVPARRAGRIMPNRKRTCLLRESVQRVGGARGAAAAPAAGLKNDQQERTTTANNACIANGVSTVYLVGVKVSRALHEVQERREVQVRRACDI